METLKKQRRVSLPWSEENDVLKTPSSSSDVHPVTGSNYHLCLFDRFDEANTTSEKEILRRITLFKELNGLVNTQRDEQLHAAYRYSSRFLNNTKPVNHQV